MIDLVEYVPETRIHRIAKNGNVGHTAGQNGMTESLRKEFHIRIVL